MSVRMTILAVTASVLAALPGAAADGPDDRDRDRPVVLDLETAYRMALARNPSLAASAARVAAAAERVKQARAAYFPRIDLSAGVSRVDMAAVDHQAGLLQARALNPAAAIDDPQTYYQTGATASWVVFDGFERKFATLRARTGARETRAARDDAQRLLLASVARTYHGAQLARENIAIAEADEAFNRRLREEAVARRKVGTGALSDVLNFEVQVNAARAAVIAARQDFTAALAGLAALLGFERAVLPDDLTLAALARENEWDMQAPDRDTSLQYAAANRPDIDQSDLSVQRAEAEVGAARADYLPDVTLTATVDADRSENPEFDRDDFGNTVALTVSYNLFAGGLTRARVREARHNHLAAQRTLRDRQLNVAADVSRALTALIAAQDQLRLQRDNAGLVQRNRDLVEKEYAAGQASLVRLNEAQRNMVQAQGRLALARVSLYQALADLDAATGRILETVTP